MQQIAKGLTGEADVCERLDSPKLISGHLIGQSFSLMTSGRLWLRESFLPNLQIDDHTSTEYCNHKTTTESFLLLAFTIYSLEIGIEYL